MSHLDTAVERATALAGGICVVAASGSGVMQGIAAAGAAAAGLIALFHVATKKSRIECKRQVAKTAREVKARLISRNPRYATDYEDASHRLGDHLERSFPSLQKLARLAVSEEGFVAAATDWIMDDLNQKGLGFDRLTEHDRFARELISIALERAVEDKDFFPKVEPHLWLEALSTLDALRGGQNRIETGVDTLRADTSALIGGQARLEDLAESTAAAANRGNVVLASVMQKVDSLVRATSSASPTERDVVEADNAAWIERTKNYTFEPLLQAIHELDHPSGRIQAGRALYEAIRESDSLDTRTGPKLLLLCEKLEAVPIFQTDWKLRRMLARVVGKVLGMHLNADDHIRIGDFCHSRLDQPHGPLLLAEAATENSRAALAMGEPVVMQLLLSGEPQVPWQLLKRWPTISPTLNGGVPLHKILESQDGWVRRRLLLTRLILDRESPAKIMELLVEAAALAASSPRDRRFLQALRDWAGFNTNVAIDGFSRNEPVRVAELLRLGDFSGKSQTFPSRFAHALELEIIEQDLQLAAGRYSAHPEERFSEGRYGYVRNHVRAAIGHSAGQAAPLIEELLGCANEGIRWAVAAELQTWWIRIPSTDAIEIVRTLIADEHPWVVRETLHRLADDPLLLEDIGPTFVRLNAQENRDSFRQAGWRLDELDRAIRRVAALDPTI